MESLVTINLHGHLGEAVGKLWKLEVTSVREAIHAIDVLTKKKLTRYLISKEKGQAKYKFLINNKPVENKGGLITEKNIKELEKTELLMNYRNLRSIDIIPVIEGSDMNQILGALLIVIGIVLIIVSAAGILVTGGSTVPGIIAGIMLVGAGIAMFLNKPPKMQPFRNIDEGGLTSYFFGGALNIMNEGGPVPVGYGECIIGSQVISVGFTIGLRYYEVGVPPQAIGGGGSASTRNRYQIQ